MVLQKIPIDKDDSSQEVKLSCFCSKNYQIWNCHKMVFTQNKHFNYGNV